jgi:hypothetical protein
VLPLGGKKKKKNWGCDVCAEKPKNWGKISTPQDGKKNHF